MITRHRAREKLKNILYKAVRTSQNSGLYIIGAGKGEKILILRSSLVKELVHLIDVIYEEEEDDD